MKSADAKIERQLPILFTGLNEEQRAVGEDAIGILLRWDKGINKKLSIGNADDVDTDKMIIESEQEHQHFRILLLEEMVRRQSSVDKQQLIETVSIYFIRLMNVMFGITKGKYLAGHLKRAAEEIYLHYEQTFQFIQEFFGSYVSTEQKAPISYVENTKAQINKKLKKAKDDFNVTNDNCSLIDTVAAVVAERLSGRFSISINSIQYMHQLVEEINEQSKILNVHTLRGILYSLNFNEENFVMAEYERFAGLSPDSLSRKERIQLLKQEQKLINQIIVRLNCYWDFSMPSLKEQINGWLNEEILFIESGTNGVINQNGTPENFDKIQTSLSVAKLALVARLLVIDKIIINRQIAPALRTIAKVFTTLQKDDISFGSLETKYHAPEKATIKMVRDMLFKWINLLGKL